MNVETPNEQIAVRCLASGDIVELDGCFYMVAVHTPGDEHTPMVFLGKRPSATRSAECLTETRYVPGGVLVRLHPHAKLVIP